MMPMGLEVLPPDQKWVRVAKALLDELTEGWSPPVELMVIKDDGSGEIEITARRHECKFGSHHG